MNYPQDMVKKINPRLEEPKRYNLVANHDVVSLALVEFRKARRLLREYAVIELENCTLHPYTGNVLDWRLRWKNRLSPKDTLWCAFEATRNIARRRKLDIPLGNLYPPSYDEQIIRHLSGTYHRTRQVLFDAMRDAAIRGDSIHFEFSYIFDPSEMRSVGAL